MTRCSSAMAQSTELRIAESAMTTSMRAFTGEREEIEDFGDAAASLPRMYCCALAVENVLTAAVALVFAIRGEDGEARKGIFGGEFGRGMDGAAALNGNWSHSVYVALWRARGRWRGIGDFCFWTSSVLCLCDGDDSRRRGRGDVDCADAFVRGIV